MFVWNILCAGTEKTISLWSWATSSRVMGRGWWRTGRLTELWSKSNPRRKSEHLHSISLPSALFRGSYFYFLDVFEQNVLMCDVVFSDRDVDPVVKAIRDGDVGTLRGLIKKSDCNLLMPNQSGWIPLHEAAHYGQEQCIKALLGGRIDPTHIHTDTQLLWPRSAVQ